MLQPASHLEYGVMVLTATKFAETGCPARKNRSGGRLCVRELLRLGGIVIALLWSGVGPAVADIYLPKIFSDSMVIQRQAEVRMAVVADADEPLVLSITGTNVDPRELKTQCDAEGRFLFSFSPPPVGGPHELTISGKSSKVVIRDVMVGDVWLCSGQSNMEWSLQKTAAEEFAFAQTEQPNLRLLTVPQMSSPQTLTDFTGNVSWVASRAETTPSFSAVAWHFGSHIERELQVPVGLIHASWGGSRIESWISATGLQSEPSLEPLLQHAQTLGETVNQRDQLSGLYHGMIAPLAGFPIKGVIWYQGEANVGRGEQYGHLLPLLIRDWRATLSAPQLPFIFIQPTTYRYKNHPPQALPEVWEAQRLTYMTTPRTGLIGTLDLGDTEDIHPIRKREVGLRLGKWALAEVYEGRQWFERAADSLPPAVVTGQESTAPLSAEKRALDNDSVVAPPNGGPPTESPSTAQPPPLKPNVPEAPQYSGPIFRSAEVHESSIILTFWANSGLRSGDDEPLRDFLIAGENQEFLPAVATVQEDCVIVSHADIPHPVAVRYAWSDTPTGNLVNEAGLPAIPFRTDRFPLLSKDRHHP